jgi:hypothetical protein
MNGRLVLLMLLSACWHSAPPPPLAQQAKPVVAASNLPGGPYAPDKLRGPYRTRLEWCTDLVKHRLRLIEGGPGGGCLGHVPIVSSGPTRVTASRGILAAELVAVGEGDLLWGPRCALVLQTAAGLFAYEDLKIRCLADQPNIVRSVAVEELAFRDVVTTRVNEALGDELVLRATVVRSTPGSGDITTTTMFVCGMGASGTPRCTPGIPVHEVGVVSTIDYRPTIAPTGMLQFDVADSEGALEDSADAAAFADRYLLRFP